MTSIYFPLCVIIHGIPKSPSALMSKFPGAAKDCRSQGNGNYPFCEQCSGRGSLNPIHFGFI